MRSLIMLLLLLTAAARAGDCRHAVCGPPAVSVAVDLLNDEAEHLGPCRQDLVAILASELDCAGIPVAGYTSCRELILRVSVIKKPFCLGDFFDIDVELRAFEGENPIWRVGFEATKLSGEVTPTVSHAAQHLVRSFLRDQRLR